jgi:uncharacterized membrane protein
VNIVSARTLATSLLGKKIVLVGFLLFAVALAVRLYGLDSQTLECEELYTLPAATGHQYVYLSKEIDSSQPPIAITTSQHRNLVKSEPGLGLRAVNAVLKRNVHLPLYFYFMHYWINWFGTSEWALRFPSALFGALTVMMIFFLGRELFNLFTGVVSSLLLAFSPDHIYYSQQARMYPLLVFLVVLSTYSMIVATRRSSEKWPYVIYALLSIAGLYTHYEYIFCLAAQTAYVWLGSAAGTRNKFQWLLTQLLIAAAFAPWVLISLAQKKTSSEVIAWVSGKLSANIILAEVVGKVIQLISVPELSLGWLSVLVTLALLTIGAISLAADRSRLFLLASWISFPIAGVLLMDALLGTRAISITRYWIVVAPALYLLISLGLQRIKRMPIQVGLMAMLGGFLLAAAVLTAQGKLRGKPDQHKEMANFIDKQVSTTRGRLVLTEGLNALPLALAYYGEQDVNILRHKWLMDQLKQRSFPELTFGATEIQLLVSGPSQAARLLEDNGFKIQGQPMQFGHVRTARYALSPGIAAKTP